MSDVIELSASQIKGKRLLYLFTSAICLLVLGLVYAWSIFAGPLGEYTGFDKGSLQITFTISMIVFFSAALAGAFINKVLSVRNTLMIAALLLLLGFTITALFAKDSVTFIYVGYGVFCAAGCGIGYNTIISTVGLWFPDKTGFASGVMMMGFGLGSLVLGSIASALMGAFGIQSTFYVLAVLGFVVTLAMAFLLKAAPANIVKEMAPEKLTAGLEEKPKIKDGIAATTPIYWVYIIYAVTGICVALTLIGSIKPGGEFLGLDASFATLLVGLVSTMNGLSRVIVGMIYDKTNLKFTLFFIVITGVVMTTAIAVAYALVLPYLYAIAAILLALSFGGIAVGAAAFAREAFGAKNFSVNLSLANIPGAFAAFMSQIVIGVTSTEGTAAEPAVWVATVGVSIVAFLAIVVFSIMYKKKKET